MSQIRYNVIARRRLFGGWGESWSVGGRPHNIQSKGSCCESTSSIMLRATFTDCTKAGIFFRASSASAGVPWGDNPVRGQRLLRGIYPNAFPGEGVYTVELPWRQQILYNWGHAALGCWGPAGDRQKHAGV